MTDQTLSSSFPRITPEVSSSSHFSPNPINTIEDTGQRAVPSGPGFENFVFQGFMTGWWQKLYACLYRRWTQLLDALKRDKLVEVKSSQMGLGKALLYAITARVLPRAKRSIAANTPDQRQCRLKPIMNPCSGKAVAECL